MLYSLALDSGLFTDYHFQQSGLADKFPYEASQGGIFSLYGDPSAYTVPHWRISIIPCEVVSLQGIDST